MSTPDARRDVLRLRELFGQLDDAFESARSASSRRLGDPLVVPCDHGPRWGSGGRPAVEVTRARRPDRRIRECVGGGRAASRKAEKDRLAADHAAAKEARAARVERPPMQAKQPRSAAAARKPTGSARVGSEADPRRRDSPFPWRGKRDRALRGEHQRIQWPTAPGSADQSEVCSLQGAVEAESR